MMMTLLEMIENSPRNIVIFSFPEPGHLERWRMMVTLLAAVEVEVSNSNIEQECCSRVQQPLTTSPTLSTSIPFATAGDTAC